MNTSDTNTKLSESFVINIVIHSVIQLFHLLSSLNRKHYCLDGGCPVGHYGSVQVSLEILLGSYSHWGAKTHSNHFPLGLCRQYAANIVTQSLSRRWLFNYWARLRGKGAWQKPWHKPFIVRLHHGPNARPGWTVHLKEKLITHGFRHTITDYDWLVAPRWVRDTILKRHLNLWRNAMGFVHPLKENCRPTIFAYFWTAAEHRLCIKMRERGE